MTTLQKFTSRKFIMALASILVIFLGDLGLTEEYAIAGLTAVYVLGQALVDRQPPVLRNVPFLTLEEENAMRSQFLAELDGVLSGDGLNGLTVGELRVLLRDKLAKGKAS